MRVKLISRPLDDFVGIRWALERLLENTGLAQHPPERYFVFGGVLRSLWTREKSRTLDVAFTDSGPAQGRNGAGAVGRNLSVSRVPYAHPGQIIEAADFTIGQVVYHAGMIHHSECFFEHLAQRLLVPCGLEREGAADTFLRVYKYVARGYGITTSDLARVVRAVEPDALKGATNTATLSDGAVLAG